MKITVTREFNNVDEAIEFIGAMDAPRITTMQNIIPGQVTGFAGSQVPSAESTGQDGPPKKPRKPRADAGRPRGPYKPRGSAGTAAPDTKAEPEGASGTSSPAPALAPTEADGIVQPSATPRPAAPSGEAPAELTEADVRATLGLLNSAPGGGMGACIKAIKDFGYERITAIPKEKYAEFDAYIRALLPKGA